MKNQLDQRLGFLIFLSALIGACQAQAADPHQVLAAPKTSQSCVILLHGLARTKVSMQPIADDLSAAGYRVVNQGYDSRSAPIAQLAAQAVPAAFKRCGSADQIHVVTHSMGAILLRQYLSNHRIDKLSRVVMLAPPNHGSEAVDHLKNVPGFNLINGPAGRELGTDLNSLPMLLGPWPANEAELGVIAGTRSISWLSFFLPGADDGKVSLTSTKLSGMRDHVTLPVTHTFMMGSGEVQRQVISFLSTGRFAR